MDFFEELMKDLYPEFSSFPGYLLWEKFLEEEKKKEAENFEKEQKKNEQGKEAK